MDLYKYIHDTPTAFSLTTGEDYHLHFGGQYSLPSDNEFVQILIAQGRLELVKKTKTTKEIK